MPNELKSSSWCGNKPISSKRACSKPRVAWVCDEAAHHSSAAWRYRRLAKCGNHHCHPLPAGPSTHSDRGAPARGRFLRFFQQLPNLCPCPGVFQVHEQVPGLLHHPGLDRMLGGSEDPDAAGAVLDDGQDVDLRAVEQVGGEEVQCQDPCAWDRRNSAQLGPSGRGARLIPALLRICQTVEGATVMPSPASSPWIRRYPATRSPGPGAAPPTAPCDALPGARRGPGATAASTGGRCRAASARSCRE
jgi:hypothetical protein